MFKFAATFTALVLAVSEVAAHGGVLSYQIGGKNYEGFQSYNSPSGQSSIQREWDTYNPLMSATDPDLACNTNGAALGNQLSATVAAGSKVTAYWNDWPHEQGPVMVYMAKCSGSCTSATASALSWFKIDQAGLISGTVADGLWGMGELVANNNSWTSTIPASLAAGEYMIRHELLAIHTANQPQFYPECAQLVVTGGGSATPSGSYLVKFPGAYSATDPSIDIDIYSSTATTYAVPGPSVFTG